MTDWATISPPAFAWAWTASSTSPSATRNPHGTGKDGRSIELFGGGVIRIRPDGTGLEVVSTGECNPRSVALSATDEIFTYGTGDKSGKWPASLTHHIVTGHYGFPYQFLTAPYRAMPIMAASKDGAGAQGICYNEDGLPAEFRGNLFFCDWGAQSVVRFEIRKAGGTHAISRRSILVSRGDTADFRPFSLTASADGSSLWIVDWAFDGYSADGPRTGRLFRLSYSPVHSPSPPPPGPPAMTSQSESGARSSCAVGPDGSQRILIRAGRGVVPQLICDESCRA